VALIQQRARDTTRGLLKLSSFASKESEPRTHPFMLTFNFVCLRNLKQRKHDLQILAISSDDVIKVLHKKYDFQNRCGLKKFSHSKKLKFASRNFFTFVKTLQSIFCLLGKLYFEP